MGRRITRKQLKQDDEFVSAAERIFRWIADNRRQLTAAIVAVCVAALVWWGVSRMDGVANRRCVAAALPCSADL